MRYHGHARLSLLDGGRAGWLRRAARSPTSRRCAAHRLHRVPPRRLRASQPGRRAGPPPGAGARRPGRGLPSSRGLRRAAAGAALVLRAARSGARARARRRQPAHLGAPPRRRLAVARPGPRRPRRARGLAPDQTITTACHLSDRGALAWFVLNEVLRWPSVRVYDGGCWEYSHLLGVPVDADEDSAPPAGAAPSQRAQA